MKIYIVTDGEYSDYHIVNVFQAKELADAWCALYGGDVNEWELGITVPEPYKWRAEIDSDGVIRGVQEIPNEPEQCYNSKPCTNADGSKPGWWRGWGVKPDGHIDYDNQYYMLQVYGTTREHAVKNAADCWRAAKVLIESTP